MKNVLIVVFVLFASTAFAQNKKLLKEYVVTVDQSAVSLSNGGSATLNFTFEKSKSFANSKVTMVAPGNLPEGLTITFEPQEGKFETAKATLSANNVKPGTYNIILSSIIQNNKKGSLVSVTVQ
ncbi:MAG: hypothetical protein O9302_03110 [Cyclobacteriaceae bacterium]|jgi:hypothetical protein|nr:hypothetical protein [Cytophagales bacterium]MCZ8327025.1 hypothetical protein [Cyclobacteriaceae bacterium]